MSKKGSQKHPVVFISYSQDSQEHGDKVLTFANKLREDGIDALLDQYEESPSEGWPKWMDRQIERSDFVLVVCTETYFRRVMGREEKGKGLGVRWESTLVYQDVYDAGSKTSRCVPVLFKDGKPEHVPKPLKSLTYYRVDTEEGYEDLYRRLTGQPKTMKPGLGKLKSLSPRKPKADFLQSSEAEARKRLRDIENIKWAMASIHIPTVDQMILDLPGYLNSKALHFWESFNGVMTNSLFHVYDEEVNETFLSMHKAWYDCVSHGSQYHVTSNPNICVFKNPFDFPLDDDQEREWNEIKSARNSLRKSLDTLLRIIRERFLEIDIDEMSKKAWEEYVDFQKEMDRRLER